MARYIDKHLDEKFEAQVTYVNSKGIYIKTREGIDGKIDTFDVYALHLMYDEATASYRDKKKGIRIRIGDKLIATSLTTDVEFNTINFTIREEDIGQIHSLRKKGR
jgi:exoribonuclease R